MSVGIVSYGLGNVGSLALSLRRVGADVSILESPLDISDHSHIVIPGVGHYATAMRLMSERGWDEAIVSSRDRGIAILGICLGMQLLAEGSTEAPCIAGLGVIPGTLEHLSTQGCTLRTPHVGWNSVDPIRESTLLGSSRALVDFYFVHSFALPMPHPSVVATAEHEVVFGAIIESENVFGVQFHPEKSSAAGRSLLTNFVKYQPC